MDEVRKRKSRSKTGIKGSKPTPLKVPKDSHNFTKIKPVIIYLRSPEVIHTQPEDFMAVVQRLTGCSSSCSQAREELILLQTKPLEEEDAAYKTTHELAVWPKDYLSEVFSPPLNSVAEELEFDMGWDKELHLFSPPSSPLFDFPLTELQPLNCLYDADNPYITNIEMVPY
ncbi:uncharacterized protein LOC131073596 [Cryptomeria japonica]|uniref:uncharacterized protein LOC131073596 n=1 Tax=Cryptomeria japonica TaxID=3369 RepID=UPI0027DA3286|nr:uncharacterized protein LOC131073596 [Cryptomeria japonica]